MRKGNERPNERRLRYSWEIGIGVSGLIAIHLPLLFSEAFRGEGLNAPNAGLFGDFIGGYIGSLFGLTTVVLLVATLRSQARAFREEKLENVFFEMINLHRANVAEMEIESSIRDNKGEMIESPKGRRAFVVMVREFRETLRLAHDTCKQYEIELSTAQLMNASYLAFYYGLGPNSTRVYRSALSEYPQRFVETFLIQLSRHEVKRHVAQERRFGHMPFEGHQSRLGHYFRHLYNCVTFVDRFNLKHDKYSLMKMLRAQLSTHEQALLYFNSLSTVGKEWRDDGLIERYKLIKHLPPGFINPEFEVAPKDVYPTVQLEMEE